MNEANIAHLRFLQARTVKGDVLTPDDFEFVMNMENELQMYQNMICKILAHENCLTENC